MTTRAKFKCNKVSFYGDPGNPGTMRQYELTAVYDESIPEDQRFSAATPWGKLEINISNPGVSFTPGSAYYLDITPADA